MKAHDQLERAFTKRVLQIYEDAKIQIGYPAHRFRRRVLRVGGRVAAKHWLRPSKATPGFQRLMEHNRLDLSVEAVALLSPWNKLFTRVELETARNRLLQNGYRRYMDGAFATAYWVVSPNVRNNKETVYEWKRASARIGAAFMGYSSLDWKHGQIGPKFAGRTAQSVQPGDRILIARRHNFEPEIVGVGVVYGQFQKFDPALKTPEEFRSMRWLKPFKIWTALPPRKVPLKKVLQHTKALVQLYPNWNGVHARVCRWIDELLQGQSFEPNRRFDERARKQNDKLHNIRIASPRTNYQLDYKYRSKEKIIRAEKSEAKLFNNYQRWLRTQGRECTPRKYGALECDAYETERNNLIEAKSSASREHIRMAVGQLLDYAYQGRKEFINPHMAVLLPKEPASDIIKWLDSLKIKVVWRDGKEFQDNAQGQFTR